LGHFSVALQADFMQPFALSTSVTLPAPDPRRLEKPMHRAIPFAIAVVAIGILAVRFAGPAAAHHSSAAFDEEGNLDLDGVVTEFQWTNPHVYIELALDGGDGGRELWQVHGESPAVLSLLGWSDRSLVPGERVSVEAMPARTPGRRAALGAVVVKADGTRLEMELPRSIPDGPPRTAADGLSGLWLTRGSPVIGAFLAPADAFPLTPAGAAAVASYDNADNPAKDCRAEPFPWVFIWPTLKRIEVGDERATIQDSLGAARSVSMHVEAHGDPAYSNHGHSIGHWEDDVLVIDTTHFAAHRRGNAWGLPSGTGKHLVERIALSADRTTLSYTFVIEDPEYLEEPISGSLILDHRPDLSFVDLPCDLESARRYLE
jgi:hypothetical protein